MKILVVEYITGGGLNKQQLPESLAREGRLMLQALVENFSRLPEIKLQLMLDWRCWGQIDTQGIDTAIINSRHDFLTRFKELAAYADAVWPIAPEFDGILENLCRMVERLGVRLLNSPAATVALTGNKLTTYQRLLAHHLPTVPTRHFDGLLTGAGPWLIKPSDGVGGSDSYIIRDAQDLKLLPRRANLLIQPHIDGLKTSLSCLFLEGKVRLLCANLQEFMVIDQQYRLTAITVNYTQDLSRYQALAADLAAAFPELWGYAGVDLIETNSEILVLEINPRLTSSFVGIDRALGLNLAESVLALDSTGLNAPTTRNHPVTLHFAHDD